MQKFYNKTIVNVGSVGNVVEFSNHNENIKDMSETIQAYYTIIESEYGERNRRTLTSIQFVRFPYDIDKEIEIARSKWSPSIDNYILELTTAMYKRNKK